MNQAWAVPPTGGLAGAGALWPAGRRPPPAVSVASRSAGAAPLVALSPEAPSVATPAAPTGTSTASGGALSMPSSACAAPFAAVAPAAPLPAPETWPGWPITANFVPTDTVSPSGTRISVTVPVTGDGTSESTLSVETSNRTSSSSIASPTCLCHFVMVPSVTVSPS